jgi:hypothetical protein
MNSLIRSALRPLLLLIVLAGGRAPARGQAVLSDLNYAALDSTELAIEEQARRLAVVLYRYVPEAVRPAITDTEALLDHYRDNPYAGEVIDQPELLKALLALPLADVRAAARGLAGRGERERYLRTMARNELYDADRKLDIESLRQAYREQSPPPELALAASAQTARAATAGDESYLNVLVAGLSDWIKRRAQEEFTVSFLTQLDAQIRRNNLHVLFPATSHFLTTVEIADYKTFLPDARLAFANDLNGLTFNVAGYLKASGALDGSDARLYNFLLVYELLDLSARGLDLPEVISYARGEMQRRQFAAEKELNLRISRALRPRSDTVAADTVLLTALNAAVAQLETVSFDLGELSSKLATATTQLINQEDLDEDLRNRAQALLQSPTATTPVTKQFVAENNLYFQEVKSLLRGQLPYEERMAPSKLNVAGYHELFDSDDATDADTLQAIGLSMLAELLRRGPDGKYQVVEGLVALADSLENWQDSLKIYQALSAGEPSISRDEVRAYSQELVARIEASREYWSQQDLTEHQQQSFVYLKKLAETYFNRQPAGTPRNRINEAQYHYLDTVEMLIEERLLSLEKQYPGLLDPSRVPTVASPRLRESVIPVREAFQELEAVYQAQRRRLGGNHLRAYENAQLFGQILGVGAELFYLLTEPDGEDLRWVSARELSRLLGEPRQRALFTGLMAQRISDANLFTTRLAPAGLTGIATGLSLSFQQLGEELQDSTNTPSAARVRFVARTLNHILETPLLPALDGSGLLSLSQRYAPLRNVPEINRQLTDIYNLTSSGRYRQSIGPLLDLLDLFQILPDSSRRVKRLDRQLSAWQQQRQNLLAQRDLTQPQLQQLAAINADIQRNERRLARSDFGRFERRLRRYAGFMAGIAAAENATEIAAVMEGTALPPGSSRTKRISSFTLGLNAYFGGGVGSESLLGELAEGVDRQQATAGLFVPVGLSVTKRIIPNTEWSATLFLPLLDIGAVTAYRSGDNAEAIPEVTFGNLLAPGLHLLINLPKSPFFLGYGIQYGPNERVIGEDNYSAYRQLFTFGIDVPIFSFASSRN